MSLVQGQAQCREKDRHGDLQQLWDRGRCCGTQESYCWNMECPATRGRSTSGKICSYILFFHFPVQSWRPIKDLEEGFISFTSQYSQLLDLVSHPCRLLYKVVFLHKNAISCCSLLRQSSITGRLKEEQEETRAICTRWETFVLINCLFKIQLMIIFWNVFSCFWCTHQRFSFVYFGVAPNELSDHDSPGEQGVRYKICDM